MIQQVIFTLIFGAALGSAFYMFQNILKNIRLGKEEVITGDSGKRWNNLLLVAFGQKKMFKNWIPAVLHLFIYIAFIITQIELIEILIDGIGGHHRFFAPLLGGFYTFVISFIEILSVLALLATIIFLVRRNFLKIDRFQKTEMKGWPFTDANLILWLEIALIFFIFLMNSADMAIYENKYQFIVSKHLSAFWSGSNPDFLHIMERIGWWGHVLVVLAFLNYLPFSKHLHILFAFPNTYFSSLNPRGKMENMPAIMAEVKSMMGLSTEAENQAEMDETLPDFGAKDVMDLSQRTILGAYSCTECGRCTAACPANLTGKKLSPRKIMMDIRDRAEEVGKNIRSGNQEFAQNPDMPLSSRNYEDGKSLFDYITREEIHACTTCNACVEACPVLINPLEPILELRRYEILTESAGPADWLPMFNAMENNGAVWAVSDDREAWLKEAN